MENKKNKPVYIHSEIYAREHGELAVFGESFRENASCTQSIDQAVIDSNYEQYRYDLGTAAKTVIDDYGADRVSFVLASILQHCDYDGRYSDSNKDWAKGFDIPDGGQVFCNTHPTVLEGFINQTRKTLRELGQTQKPETVIQFDDVAGYEIKQAVLFENDRGFAYALTENPDMPSPFVTWQYTEENGVKDFYWGHYFSNGDSARDDFSERVADYKSEHNFAEKYNYIAATEMSKEQNYNMIDGLHNNETAPKADLTDGQTHDEILELAPETLPDNKPSVVDRLREARDNPLLQDKNDKKLNRSSDAREL